MIYFLTAIGLRPVAAVQYTFTHKQYTEQHKNFGRLRTVSSLCELYPGNCLTSEEISRKILISGSQRIPVGTVKTEYTEQIMYVLKPSFSFWLNMAARPGKTMGGKALRLACRNEVRMRGRKVEL